MADKFQPDFYVTCATVIPVLFLAAAVQGRPLELLEQMYTEMRAERVDGSIRRSKTLASNLLPAIAACIVLAGAWGEITALLALYSGSEAPFGRRVVLASTLILAVAVAVLPIAVGMRAAYQRGALGSASQSPNDDDDDA